MGSLLFDEPLCCPASLFRRLGLQPSFFRRSGHSRAIFGSRIWEGFPAVHASPGPSEPSTNFILNFRPAVDHLSVWALGGCRQLIGIGTSSTATETNDGGSHRGNRVVRDDQAIAGFIPGTAGWTGKFLEHLVDSSLLPPGTPPAARYGEPLPGIEPYFLFRFERRGPLGVHDVKEPIVGDHLADQELPEETVLEVDIELEADLKEEVRVEALVGIVVWACGGVGRPPSEP